MKVPISDPKSYDQSRRLGAGSFKIMSGPSRTTVGICGKYMCVFTEDRPTRNIRHQTGRAGECVCKSGLIPISSISLFGDLIDSVILVLSMCHQ